LAGSQDVCPTATKFLLLRGISPACSAENVARRNF
jgi:hypothetical protein